MEVEQLVTISVLNFQHLLILDCLVVLVGNGCFHTGISVSDMDYSPPHLLPQEGILVQLVFTVPYNSKVFWGRETS